MSLVKMCFYIETCGRVFLITMKMLDVFYELEVEGNEERGTRQPGGTHRALEASSSIIGSGH